MGGKGSKNKRHAEKKPEVNFKRGLIYAVIGFIILAAIYIYLNRDEPVGGTAITLIVAAMGATFGLWVVYRLNVKK